MSTRPFQFNGYEIDRKWLKEIEAQIQLYPIRKARMETLQAKYPDAELDIPDFHTYRSPQVDSMPGAPGKVGNPTLNRVVERATAVLETQNLAYLSKWVDGMDLVLKRLNSVQRTIVEKYVMLPTDQRPQITAVVQECHASQTQCYYWRNEAFMAFAFLLLDEKHIRKLPEKNPKS